MARGSKLTIEVDAHDLPLLPAANDLAQQGCITGASHRNWTSYGHDVSLPEGFPEWRRHLLTDPQTSGGLLIACAPDVAPSLAETIKSAGYPFTRIIGRAMEGPASVRVRA
jgi:selenide,water dikinase